jgi:hypothetical protein
MAKIDSGGIKLRHIALKICSALIVFSAMSACTTTSTPAKQPVVSVEQYFKDAEAAMAAGKPDQALVVLDKASSAHPTRKEPWVRAAQINFDAGNYGSAIVKAQEALQRDPGDLQSNSILAVAGLRVSTKALADLRQGQALKGGVRTDAESLAKILRETLGESVLVPVAGTATSGSSVSSGVVIVDTPPPPRPVAKPRVNNAAKPTKPAPKAPDSPDNANSDPFGALRK